jgi:anti-anti-sigma factor
MENDQMVSHGRASYERGNLRRDSPVIESSHFRVDVEDDGTLLVLRLHGELDLMSVPTVEEAIERHGGRQAVVVDLGGLEFMDSSGLRMIVELRNRDDGTGVAFVAPVEQRVGRVLDMTGVRSKLTWVTEPREALG